MRRVLLAAAVVAALAPVVAVPASAGPIPHMVVGDWDGFYNAGVDNPDFMGPASLMVDSQTNRRFMGEFMVDNPALVDDPEFQVDGTMAGSGHLSATGRMGMDHLVIQGMTTELEEQGGISPCVFEGRWMLTGPAMHADGALGMVHRVGDDDAVATGRWMGMARHADGTESGLTADFRTDQMMEGMGMMMVGDSFFDVFFDLAIGNPNERQGTFILAGGGEAGIIVIGGRYQPPPDGDSPARIDGFHRLHMLGGGVLEGTFFLEQQA